MGFKKSIQGWLGIDKPAKKSGAFAFGGSRQRQQNFSSTTLTEELSVPDIRKRSLALKAGRLYDRHGLASLIVDRNKTFVFERGMELSVKFVPGFPIEVAKQIEARLYEFWESKEVNLMDRTETLLIEGGINGEHYWPTKVYTDGTCRIGEIDYMYVEAVGYNKFDPRQLEYIRVNHGNEESKILWAVQKSYDSRDPLTYKHMMGDVFQFRFGHRNQIRGLGLLQQIIDELQQGKEFTTKMLDSLVYVLHSILVCKVEEGEDQTVEDLAKKMGNYFPELGEIMYVGDGTEWSYLQPNMQSGDWTGLLKSLTGMILGMKGMPESWAGFADSSTKGTASTQQYPIFADYYNRQKSLLRYLESVMTWVADCAIISGYNLSARVFEAQILDGKNVIAKHEMMLRDGIKITVTPIPLPKEGAGDYEATDQITNILTKDGMNAQAGTSVMTQETAVELTNEALAKDKSGVRVSLAEDDKKVAGQEGIEDDV